MGYLKGYRAKIKVLDAQNRIKETFIRGYAFFRPERKQVKYTLFEGNRFLKKWTERVIDETLSPFANCEDLCKVATWKTGEKLKEIVYCEEDVVPLEV